METGAHQFTNNTYVLEMLPNKKPSYKNRNPQTNSKQVVEVPEMLLLQNPAMKNRNLIIRNSETESS